MVGRRPRGDESSLPEQRGGFKPRDEDTRA
jgi:hypothetical protein